MRGVTIYRSNLPTGYRELGDPDDSVKAKLPKSPKSQKRPKSLFESFISKFSSSPEAEDESPKGIDTKASVASMSVEADHEQSKETWEEFFGGKPIATGPTVKIGAVAKTFIGDYD